MEPGEVPPAPTACAPHSGPCCAGGSPCSLTPGTGGLAWAVLRHPVPWTYAQPHDGLNGGLDFGVESGVSIGSSLGLSGPQLGLRAGALPPALPSGSPAGDGPCSLPGCVLAVPQLLCAARVRFQALLRSFRFFYDVVFGQRVAELCVIFSVDS